MTPITRSRFRPRYPSSSFAPGLLFLAGEQGAWYDPSDLSTLFQDAAGTVPVTAVEQSVRLMRDKSGRGNNATAPSDAARPVLRARYNLLTESEFRNGVTDAPIRGGLLTATTMTGFAGALAFGKDGVTGTFAYKSFAHAAGSTYTMSVFVQMDDGLAPTFANAVPSSGLNPFAVISNGQVAASASEYVVTQISGSLYRVSWTYVASGTNGNTGVVAYTTNNNRTFKVTGYQLIVTNSLLSNAYQRIADAATYDTAGFLPYLAFDGTDDSLLTNSVDFTATDKMTVWAGVRKLSDAATALIAELSANAASNAGSFWVAAPVSNGAANYEFRSGGSLPGTGIATYTNAAIAAPVTNVVTAIGDIAAPAATLRVNGAQVGSSSSDQGTGNFGNYALFIGGRNNTSLRLNGRLYGLIVRGAATSAAQVTSTERWMAGKTGVTI